MLKVSWDPTYALPLPEGHRFPMEKYELIPQQLKYEGLLSDQNFFTPTPCSDVDILRVHERVYYQKLLRLELTKQEIRKSGFPLSAELIEREVLIAGGTLEGSYHAMEHGIAMNVAGGTHHAYTNRAEGFCLLNDQAIAAAHLLHHKKVKQVLIIDLDVHQGNGTAEIFENNASVFTFSMHGKNNYPLKKEVSDLDVGLDDGIDDTEYLNELYKKIKFLLSEIQPDFVFYQAGVDVLATDKLGRLGLSMEGCKKRDELVIHSCRQKNIPLVICMGGGYSPKIAHIVEAHANTFRVAVDALE